MRNKILFSGCSYTWGQGLELAYPPNYGQDWKDRCINWPLLSEEQKSFIKENRWTKLVSDRLNLEEVNLSRPGHSNGESLSKLQEYINQNGLKNVKYVFLQLTSEMRDYSFECIEGIDGSVTGMELALIIERKLNETNGWNNLNQLKEFDEKLEKSREFMKEKHQIFLQKTSEWFTDLEKNNDGLKCYFIEWNKEIPIDNRNNKFLLNLFEKYQTVQQWSDSMGLRGDDWMRAQNFECFGENHLSIDGHKIFSNILISKIN